MCKRKSDTLNINPKIKKQHLISKYGVPIYQIELSKNWLMIITTNADRFYFHIPEEISYWQIPNGEEDSIEANKKLEEMQDIVLLLVALIRGFVVGNDAPDKVYSCMEKLKQLFEKNDQKNAPEDDNLIAEDLSKDEAVVDAKSGGLIMGYYSSSENENEEEIDMDNNKSKKEIDWEGAEEVEETHEAEEAEEQEGDEYGLNLSDLDDMLEISDTENNGNNEQDETLRQLNLLFPEYKEQKSQLLFLKMLDRRQPDPFSSYDLEVDELCKEPEFITVDDNNLRNELFDYWCRLQEKSVIKNDNLDECDKLRSKLDNSNKDKQNMESNPVLDFINYLKGLEKIPSFYVDFKRKNRKNEDFGNLELPEKIKQSIYKRYVSFKKLGSSKKREFLLDKIGNLRQKETLSLKLNDIENGRCDIFLELTFLIDNEETILKEEIFKIIQNLL